MVLNIVMNLIVSCKVLYNAGFVNKCKYLLLFY